MNNNVNETIKAVIEAQVIQALKSAPEAIDALVKAALNKNVDYKGEITSYSGTPYLEYIAANEIRQAARDAVRKVIAEQIPNIEAAVKAKFSTDDMAKSIANAFVSTANQEWRIDIKFDREERR